MEEDLSLRYQNGSSDQAPGGVEAPGAGLSSVHQRPQPHGFLVQLDSSHAPIGARIHTFDAPKDPFDQPQPPGTAHPAHAPRSHRPQRLPRRPVTSGADGAGGAPRRQGGPKAAWPAGADGASSELAMPPVLREQLASLRDGVATARWLIRLMAHEEQVGTSSAGPFVTLLPCKHEYDLAVASVEWAEGGSASIAGISGLSCLSAGRAPGTAEEVRVAGTGVGAGARLRDSLPWREGAVIMSKRGVLRVAEGAATSLRLVKDGSLADFISEAAVYSIAAGTRLAVLARPRLL